MRRLTLVILMCMGAGSCARQLPTGPDLFVDFRIIETFADTLSSTAKSIMNGVYEVVDGSDVLGNPVVGRWVGRRWCLYSQHDAVYSESAGGASGDSIQLTGYVRYIRSGSGTRVRFTISSNEGGWEILRDSIPSSLRIRGTRADGGKIELRRARDITSSPPQSPFHVLAHRGGARNSDRLGISENSIAMIQHAAILGATGIEIDVKRTRDDKIIVFHDDTFSPRTVQGAYLLGRVENYDLEQIKLFGRLTYGEPIPTLTEALHAVIDTNLLSLVWIDVKDARSVVHVARIQREATNYAAAKGRPVSILLGIPSNEVLKAYEDLPITESTDVLVELDAGTAFRLQKCRAWGPVWTRDITTEEITSMQAAGRIVFTWTVDLRESMVAYMNKGVNGILTNYPSLVAGIHDSKE